MHAAPALTLLTGATGFVGAAVARRLKAEGVAVRVLARPGSDRRNLAGLDVQVAEGDLRDEASLQRAIQGCDGLFHVAADYRLWAPDPAPIYESNVEGTRRLLRAAQAAGVRRVVYTSSVATLGLPQDGTPGDEDTPVSLADMVGHYKRSKYLAEDVARDFAAQGLDVVIVNPSTPVGPRDLKPTPTGRMVLDAAAGKMPAFVDTGLNIAHVDDVAAGHWLAWQRGERGRRYVLGGTDLSLRQILALIAGMRGRRPPRVCIPHALVLPPAYVAQAWARLTGSIPNLTVEGVKLSRKKMFFSCDRARRELGYDPRQPADALADAISWFESNGDLGRAAGIQTER